MKYLHFSNSFALVFSYHESKTNHTFSNYFILISLCYLLCEKTRLPKYQKYFP